MTCQNDPEIRRCADGTIDFAFYEARARRLRGALILRSPSRMLAARAHGWPGAADRVVAAIRSAMFPRVRSGNFRHSGTRPTTSN